VTSAASRTNRWRGTFRPMVWRILYTSCSYRTLLPCRCAAATGILTARPD
jgi:hypothetical protein